MKRIWLILLIAVGFVPAAAAWQTLLPTPPPTVTAEREPWFLSGEPITYEGSTYLPTGARIHFIPSEMVRSGSYRGVPLYARTTIEPYSVVFVPLPGGLMQPYERRRVGELTGTVGSTTPSFPVGPSAGPGSGVGLGTGPQAAGPPLTIPPSIQAAPPVITPSPAPPPPEPVPAPDVGTTAQTLSAPAVGTSGRAPAGRRAVTPPRSQGINGMFVEFQNVRWFSHGSATLVDPSRFVRIGDYHGAPVYRDPNGSPRVIYIPLNRDAQDLVAPFERRK
jgi:hypothetical protein